MSAAERVSVWHQAGVIVIQRVGRLETYNFHLTASQAECIAPELVKFAAEIKAHPAYQQLREDQR